MKDEVALKVAELLLQIKAVKLQPDKPFTWASGWKSPIYCDNRIALSHPKVRTFIRQSLVKKIEEHYSKPDVIAAVATAAIAQGALVAEAMELPFVYVRPKPKNHGMENLIEGEIKPGQTVVVIEDLVSTGGSSVAAVRALKEAGLNVVGCIAIFSYGMSKSIQAFAEENVPLCTLTDFKTLIETAVKKKYIKEEEKKKVLEWAQNPEEWGKKYEQVKK